MKPHTIESFMTKVYPEPNTGCWLWGGLSDKDGYGRVSPKKFKVRSAHRLSYLFFKGDFDRSLVVCHTCDVPSCVNPDHLFLGTTIDNVRDRQFKGRTAHGERHFSNKLNVYEVRHIRELFKSGISPTEIAPIFGVTASNIRAIGKLKIWKHLC